MVILFRGKPGIKRESSTASRGTMMQPVVGTNKDTEPFIGLGVGVTEPDGDDYLHFWGTADHDLPRSYRAMQLSERLDFANEAWLADCWIAGHAEDDRDKADRIKAIEDIVGQTFREYKLQQMLPDMDDALSLLREKGIEVNVHPLLREIKAKRLAQTPGIELAIQDYADWAFLINSNIDPLVWQGMGDYLEKGSTTEAGKACKEASITMVNFVRQNMQSLLKEPFYALITAYNHGKPDPEVIQQDAIGKKIVYAQRALINLERAMAFLQTTVEALSDLKSDLYFFSSGMIHIAGKARSDRYQNGETPGAVEEQALTLLRNLNRAAQKELGFYKLA
ncbi:MAG: hypothetical protein ABIH34_04675 [Nanoarchaeota archaeon]